MEADASLGRAAGDVVLDPVAAEDLDVAVVHLHREADCQLTLRGAEDRADPGVELQVRRDAVELHQGRVERGGCFGSRGAPLAQCQSHLSFTSLVQ